MQTFFSGISFPDPFAANSREKWDFRFMLVASVIGSWSKDPSTQCGCLLVDQERRLVSGGFNGFPRGVEDRHERLTDREKKLAMVIHAEENAIQFAQRTLVGCTAYVWPMPPCARCAGKLIQAGISRIVTGQPTSDQLRRWGRDFALANEMYAEAGVELHFLTEGQADVSDRNLHLPDSAWRAAPDPDILRESVSPG